MDIIMNHENVKKLFKEVGEDNFLLAFKTFYPSLELYSYGLSWLIDKKYILKFRGTAGDLVVEWE